MVVTLAIVLVVHGLIHLLGFAKAFQLADLPQLTQPVPQWLGVLWLFAAILFCSAAVALFLWPRGWWALGACAVAISMPVVVMAWTDAKFGALGNLIIVVAVLFGYLAHGPTSLETAYQHDVARALGRATRTEVVRDADLSHLPATVQRYLRNAGIVGQPRVRNFRVHLRGRIRSSAGARWMPLVAEQHNVIEPPARLFYLNASMFGVPVQGYHRYVGTAATMIVRAAALVPVAQAAGPDMDQSETVTMFNDMCFLAPATLIDPAIAWETLDERTVRAAFTNAGHTIRANLEFNDAGEMTNFWSDDRYQTSPDGKTQRKARWSTPLSAYRSFGPVRLASRGAARWQNAQEDYAYIELTIDDVQYNVSAR
jgi:hypothetical protein